MCWNLVSKVRAAQGRGLQLIMASCGGKGILSTGSFIQGLIRLLVFATSSSCQQQHRGRMLPTSVSHGTLKPLPASFTAQTFHCVPHVLKEEELQSTAIDWSWLTPEGFSVDSLGSISNVCPRCSSGNQIIGANYFPLFLCKSHTAGILRYAEPAAASM